MRSSFTHPADVLRRLHVGRPPRMRLAAVLVLAMLGMGLASSPAQACPNCKSAMTAKEGEPVDPDTEQRVRMGRGYNLSIMLMLPVPFLLVAGLGGFIYFQMKKETAFDGGLAGDLAAEPTASPDADIDDAADGIPGGDK